MRLARRMYFASRARSLPTAVTASTGNAVAIALIHQAGHVATDWDSNSPPMKTCTRRRDVHPDGVLHADGDLFVGQLFQDAGRRWRA